MSDTNITLGAPADPAAVKQTEAAEKRREQNAARGDGGQDKPNAAQKKAQRDSTKQLDKADGVQGTDFAQEIVDTEQAVGYRGHNPSPVPNHHYTVAGVTAGLPTPENDPDLRDEMHKRLDMQRHLGLERSNKKGGK